KCSMAMVIRYERSVISHWRHQLPITNYQSLVDLALAEVLAVEGDQPLLVVHHRFEMYRPRPELMDIAHRVAGVVHLEVDALVTRAQIQLAAVVVVAVLDVDKRLAVVGEPEQQLLLDLLELTRSDLVEISVAVIAEGEQLLL